MASYAIWFIQCTLYFYEGYDLNPMTLPRKIRGRIFDDILIYSRSRDEHLSHLRSVCSTLQKEKFYANPKKCAFLMDSVTFLGFILSSQGMQ